MIFVCGISASGKSSIVRAFTSANPDFSHVKGSDLLQKAGLPIRSLDHASAERNQHALLEILASQGLIEERAIFDGHITIEATSGPYSVPNWFFREARVRGIICVTNDAAIIAQRRNDQRFAPGMTVEALQDLEKESAKAHARELGIPYQPVHADDQNSFAAAVNDILGC